ncbi:MAG: AMP-binding protein [Deltaproteobacteria bacterium]|nr:AMP-binding protein [Deltaproteobacteria bacterium]
MEETRLSMGAHRQPAKQFQMMEELITSAREISAPEQIILERAGGGHLEMGECLTNIDRISNMFVELGFRKNRNVAVFLPNCLEYAYFYLTLGRLGITVLPVNQFLKGEPLSYVLNHCDIEFLITNKELFLNVINPISESLEHVHCVIFLDEKVPTEKFESTAIFSDFKNFSSDFKQPWPVNATDVAVIWLTSGTTGLPKGVVCTQEYLLQRMSYSVEFFGLNSRDVIYFILPMYHIPFYTWGVPMAMAAGCKLVFVDWFSASKFWEHAATYQATVVYSTGTIIPILLKSQMGEFEQEARERIRFWGAWPVDQPEVVFKRWPKTRFVSGYGLSEYALATNHFYNEKDMSQGPATPFTELKICDPDTGETLPTGVSGEIVVRSKLGPGFMMQCYYKSPEATIKTIRDGWLYTGDGGYLDDKGKLHFVDRLKDSVRVGGENVPSVQVEGIIASHPKIAEVAVTGVKGELGSDEIAAHLVLKEGEHLAAEEFFQFCEDRMAYFMVPGYLRIHKELPKTTNLKVQKYKLREEGLTEDYFRRAGPKRR